MLYVALMSGAITLEEHDFINNARIAIALNRHKFQKDLKRVLKRLGGMTLDELINYCDAQEYCWRCNLARICADTSIDISALVVLSEIAEIQVETKQFLPEKSIIFFSYTDNVSRET